MDGKDPLRRPQPYANIPPRSDGGERPKRSAISIICPCRKELKVLEKYKVKIDQLPEEVVNATDPEDASRQVSEMITGIDSLRRLHDDEPVQIKRPDGTPWGRNLTIGEFRKGPVLAQAHEHDGPLRPPSVG